MFKSNSICRLFNIQYPVVQAGMVWVSGANLASAAANAGCLGLIGAGSMSPELLSLHIEKAFKKTKLPFGVNLPLLYHQVDKQIEVALEKGIRIFFTSAGSPKKYTQDLKKEGCIVVHVTSSTELALKCQDAGVDAVVCEGFEAGGHNGRDETTTMSLIPNAKKHLKIPIIAAGGIASGRQMAAALCLGANGVQVGSAFVISEESSAHQDYKNYILNSKEGETKLMMKRHVPVRLLRNEFSVKVQEFEDRCASKEELVELLGKGRARKGMLEGDLSEGELEIGQVACLLSEKKPLKEIVTSLLEEYQITINELKHSLD